MGCGEIEHTRGLIVRGIKSRYTGFPVQVRVLAASVSFLYVGLWQSGNALH